MGGNTNRRALTVSQLHSPFSPTPFLALQCRHQTIHFSLSTDSRELILCLTAFAFANALADRPTDRTPKSGSSRIRPGGNRFRQIKEEEEEEEGSIGNSAWVPRIGPLPPPNKHPREFLRVFLRIPVFCVSPGPHSMNSFFRRSDNRCNVCPQQRTHLPFTYEY